MNLQQLLNNPAIQVFLGTFPLLLTMAYGMYQNNARLARVEAKLDQLDGRMSKLEVSNAKVEERLESMNQRLVRVEGKLDNPKLVMS